MATGINQSTAQAGEMLQQLYGGASDLANQNAALITQTGDAAAMVAKTAGLAEVEAQQRTLEAATNLGTNPADAAFMLAELGTTVRDTYRQRDQAILATQKASQSNLFLDGPVEWLSQQAALPFLQENQQVAEARYINAKDAYATLNNLTQEAAQTNVAIAQTKNVTTVEAQAQAIRDEAAAKANAARIQGLQLNAEGIKEAQAMQQRMFDNNMRMQSMAMEQARFKLAQEEAADRKKQRAQNEKDVSTYLGAVNASRVSVGLPPYDEQQMRLKAGTAAGKAELDDWFEKGLVATTTGRQVIGNTPFDSMQTLSQNPTARPAPGTQSLLQQVGAFAGSQVSAAQQAGQLKNAKEIPTFANKTIQAEAERQQKNVTTKGNWYSPPPLASMMDAETQNLPVVRIVIAPAIASGATDFQPEVYLPQALEAVRKGELTMNEAVSGISALAKKAVAYNNGYRNYQGIGLPMQQTLPMKLETTGPVQSAVNEVARQTTSSALALPFQLFSGKDTKLVDIADEKQVQVYANQYMAGKIAVNIREAAGKLKKTQ